MAYTDNKIRSRIENSILATVAAFLMVVGHGAQSRAASSPTKVIIAHATINPRVAPLWVAKGEGFFTKYGVEAEVVNVKGGSGSVCSFWWLLDVLERGVVRNFLSFILTNSQSGLACSNRLRPTTLKGAPNAKLISLRGV